MDSYFDKNKGVYRVNNPDGTFSTYTPKDYHALLAEKEKQVPIEAEEPDIIIEAFTPRKFSIVGWIKNLFNI